MNNLIIKNLTKELERLKNFNEIIGNAIVHRNGLLVSSNLPRDIDERKIGALAATMFEAIETVTSSFEQNQIKNLTVDYQDFKLIIVGIDDKMINVSLIENDTNLGLIFIEIEESIKNIKNIITGDNKS